MTQKRKMSFGVLGIAATVAILITTGCNKDDYGITPDEQLLTAHDWKITALSVPSATNPSADSSIMAICDLESKLTFSTNYNFDFDNIATGVCSPTNFYYDSGTWSLDSYSDSLYLSGVSRRQSWKVYELSDTLLKASYKDSISPTEFRDTKITLTKY